MLNAMNADVSVFSQHAVALYYH